MTNNDIYNTIEKVSRGIKDTDTAYDHIMKGLKERKRINTVTWILTVVMALVAGYVFGILFNQ